VLNREKLRREAEERAGQEIDWDDSKEREFRARYIQLR
jgi:hypothetical protein